MPITRVETYYTSMVLQLTNNVTCKEADLKEFEIKVYEWKDATLPSSIPGDIKFYTKFNISAVKRDDFIFVPARDCILKRVKIGVYYFLKIRGIKENGKKSVWSELYSERAGDTSNLLSFDLNDKYITNGWKSVTVKQKVNNIPADMAKYEVVVQSLPMTNISDFQAPTAPANPAADIKPDITIYNDILGYVSFIYHPIEESKWYYIYIRAVDTSGNIASNSSVNNWYFIGVGRMKRSTETNFVADGKFEDIFYDAASSKYLLNNWATATSNAETVDKLQTILSPATFSAVKIGDTALVTKAGIDVYNNKKIYVDSTTKYYVSFYVAVDVNTAALNDFTVSIKQYANDTIIGTATIIGTITGIETQTAGKWIYEEYNLPDLDATCDNIEIVFNSTQDNVYVDELNLVNMEDFRSLTLTSDTNVFVADQDNVPLPNKIITFTANLKKFTNENITWTVVPSNLTLKNADGTANAVSTDKIVTISTSDVNLTDAVSQITVKATSIENSNYSDSVQINRVVEGSDALTILLDNNPIGIPVDAAGNTNTNSFTNAIVNATLLRGATDITHDSKVVWTITDNTGITSTKVNDATYVKATVSAITTDTATITFKAVFTKPDTTTITITKDCNVVIVKQGDSGIVGYLTNEDITVPTNSDGSGGQWGIVNVFTYFKVIEGGIDVTTNYTFAVVSATGFVLGSGDYGIYTGTGEVWINSMSVDSGSLTIEATNIVDTTIKIDRTFTVSKSKSGATAKLVQLTSDGRLFTFDADNITPNPALQTITFNVNVQNIIGSIIWSSSPTVAISITNGGLTASLAVADFGTNSSATITASITEGAITYSDSITVYRQKITGDPGANGAPTYTWIVYAIGTSVTNITSDPLLTAPTVDTEYMGVLSGKLTQTPDTSFANRTQYNWAKITDVMFTRDATITHLLTIGTVGGAGELHSADYVAGSAGWIIKTGAAEFNNATITSTSGSIGSWKLFADSLYSLVSGTPTLNPNTGIVIKSGTADSGLYIYNSTNLMTRVGLSSVNNGWGEISYLNAASTVIDDCSVTTGWSVVTGKYHGTGTIAVVASGGTSNSSYLDLTNSTSTNTYFLKSYSVVANETRQYTIWFNGVATVTLRIDGVYMSTFLLDGLGWKSYTFDYTSKSTTLNLEVEVSYFQTTGTIGIDNIYFNTYKTTTNLTQKGLFISNSPTSYIKFGDGIAEISGNLDIGGTLYIAGGSDTTKNGIEIQAGNSIGNDNSNQLLFGYNGQGTYRHVIKTAHDSSTTANNIIKFYLWDALQNSTDIGDNLSFLINSLGQVSTGDLATTYAGLWKLGKLITTTVNGVDTTKYLKVEVDGTEYKLALAY